MEDKIDMTSNASQKPVALLYEHLKLIELMKALNYRGSEGGTCNGFAFMGMQAVFANELDVFNKRVERLLEIPLEDFEKSAKEQLVAKGNEGKSRKDLLRENLEDYLKQNDLLIDTLAFFDGVELHQQRHLYPHLFEATESLAQDGFLKFTVPEKIKSKGEIVSLPGRPSGVYKQDELASDYFALLREKIKAMSPQPTDPICLSIGGYGLQHAIAVSYNAQNDKWTIIDANHPPSQEYSDDISIAKALIKGHSKNEIVAIETMVYTYAEDEQVKQVLTDWMGEIQNRAKKDIKNKIKWSDSHGGTWLIAAIIARDHELIPELLAHGPEINKPRSTDNSTPLKIATILQDIKIMELLLRKGADPNVRIPAGALTPFELAITTNNYEAVKLMLIHGAQFLIYPHGDHNFNVDIAVMNGRLESLRAILDSGFNPNSENMEERNLLFLAVKNNQFEAARLLLEYGANPDYEDPVEEKFAASARNFAKENNLTKFIELFDQPLMRKEVTSELVAENAEKNEFIKDLENYCITRRTEWNPLPKWLHHNEKEMKAAQYKTKLISLKFGFSVEDKIKAAEKLIAILQDKKEREPLSDFDIAALKNSRLYSTVVKNHEDLFQQIIAKQQEQQIHSSRFAA